MPADAAAEGVNTRPSAPRNSGAARDPPRLRPRPARQEPMRVDGRGRGGQLAPVASSPSLRPDTSRSSGGVCRSPPSQQNSLTLRLESRIILAVSPAMCRRSIRGRLSSLGRLQSFRFLLTAGTAEVISLASELPDPTALIGAIGRFQQPIVLAPRENHQIFLAEPEQRVHLRTTPIPPFVYLSTCRRVLDHPAHPANPLTAAQVGRTVVLHAAFLDQVPEGRPAPRRFRQSTATHPNPAKGEPAARNLGDKNAVEFGFIGGPVASKGRKRYQTRRPHPAVS